MFTFVVIGAIILIASIFLPKSIPHVTGVKRIVGMLGIISLGVGTVFGGFNYAEPGYIYHVRTIFGQENMVSKTGWFFAGWKEPIPWKRCPTIVFDDQMNSAESTGASSIHPPYRVRMLDNVSGNIHATVRFCLPDDPTQFLKIAHEYRTPGRLVSTTLRTAVVTAMDATADSMSAEKYFSGNRNDFKIKFAEAITKGVPVYKVTETKIPVDKKSGPSAAIDIPDRTDLGEDEKIVRTVKEIKAPDGTVQRREHKYAEFGVRVTEAVMTNFDPSDTFETRMDAKQKAAADRSIARERRIQEEEERLLAIAKGQREIAQEQAAQQKAQIAETTKAETQRKLFLITANRQKEQAAIDKQTAEIALEKAKVDAEAIQVIADANAYEREKLLEADNALDKKLKAAVEIHGVWAQAFAKRRVPATVFSTGDTKNNGLASDGNAAMFMQILGVKAARDLALDMEIEAKKKTEDRLD